MFPHKQTEKKTQICSLFYSLKGVELERKDGGLEIADGVHKAEMHSKDFEIKEILVDR